VLTGQGQAQQELLRRQGYPDVAVAQDLGLAVAHILGGAVALIEKNSAAHKGERRCP
jgi:hypothetical protein